MNNISRAKAQEIKADENASTNEFRKYRKNGNTSPVFLYLSIIDCAEGNIGMLARTPVFTIYTFGSTVWS